MNERIRKLRRTLDLTQEKFAERIGVKRNTIATYESGRNEPVDSVIALICREFNVNEVWLRTGEGNMFLPESSEELDTLATKYKLSDKDYMFIEKLLKNPDMREVLENFCIEFATALIAKTETGNYDIPETPEELEAAFPPLDDSEVESG